MQTGCSEPTGLKGCFPRWAYRGPLPCSLLPHLSGGGAAGCAPGESIEDKPTVLAPSVHVEQESGAVGGGALRARETPRHCTVAGRHGMVGTLPRVPAAPEQGRGESPRTCADLISVPGRRAEALVLGVPGSRAAALRHTPPPLRTLSSAVSELLSVAASADRAFSTGRSDWAASPPGEVGLRWPPGGPEAFQSAAPVRLCGHSERPSRTAQQVDFIGFPPPLLPGHRVTLELRAAHLPS